MPAQPDDFAPVDLLPVDISAYAKGNTGIDYVHRLDGPSAGPHVVVNALTHGNELCGAHALAFLFEHDVRPVKGTLTLSFANVAAYRRFDVANPSSSRFVDEDFNRLWTDAVLDGPRRSSELSRARALRPVVAAADFLLDIHSMQRDRDPLMMCGVAAKGRHLAEAVGFPAHIVADAGHAAGARMRDYGAFADPTSVKTALLVECGQHWTVAARDAAIETTLRFLDHLGLIDRDFAHAHLPAAPPAPTRLIEVTGPVPINSERFRFTGDFRGLQVIAEAGTVIGYDGETPVATPYDACVLIMPSRRLVLGQTAVRFGRFVG